jgi:hypothetical protein
VLTAICSYAALGGFLFLSPMYLQDVRGLSALNAGLLLLSAGAALAICAPVGGRIVARRGTRIPLLIAGAALTLSSAALSRLTSVSPGSGVELSYALFGIGSGMVNTAITSTAVAGMPTAQAGVASGISSASRQVGLSLGGRLRIPGSPARPRDHQPPGAPHRGTPPRARRPGKPGRRTAVGTASAAPGWGQLIHMLAIRAPPHRPSQVLTAQGLFLRRIRISWMPRLIRFRE